MGRQRDVNRPALVATLVLALSGCAIFGGGGEEVGTPQPATATDEPAVSKVPAEDSADPSTGTMEDRFDARDYAGVLARFDADSTLHDGEAELYMAGLAAAMTGHPGHDPRRAARHFRRLLEFHPDTRWRPEAELYLELLARQRELQATIDRLDRELRQLKAIDLGQAPEEEEP